MLAKDPERRIRSARQVATALEAVRDGRFHSPVLSVIKGRVEKELAKIQQLLADDPTCRLISLIGPGGIGKSRLAVEVGQRLLSRYPDGVYFVPLAGPGHATGGSALAMTRKVTVTTSGGGGSTPWCGGGRR